MQAFKGLAWLWALLNQDKVEMGLTDPDDVLMKVSMSGQKVQNDISKASLGPLKVA